MPTPQPLWSAKADTIINLGKTFIKKTPAGKPVYDYKLGATFEKDHTFDCSSFMQYVFGKNGIKLPRTSREQSKVGTAVSYQNLRKGDLILFTNEDRKDKVGIEHIGHVGVYIGDGKMLHTSKPGVGPTVKELEPYWKSMFVTARRVLQ